MPVNDQTPEYRVLVPTFFEPDLIPAGARVKWEGAPGDHLEPLNAAAKARMDAWYEQEIDLVETQTGKTLGKVKPHRGMSFVSAPTEPAAPMQLLAVPDHDDESSNIMTLAQITTARKATDQRPGPATPPKYKEKVLVQPTPPEADT
jgi:hypothetical protein